MDLFPKRDYSDILSLIADMETEQSGLDDTDMAKAAIQSARFMETISAKVDRLADILTAEIELRQQSGRRMEIVAYITMSANIITLAVAVIALFVALYQ